MLRDFLQRQIEAQLRNMLQEDLPVMIHNLSTRYIQKEEKKKEEQERQQKLERQQSLNTTTITPIIMQRFRSIPSISTCPELDSYSFHHGRVSSINSSVYTPTLSLNEEDDDLSITSSINTSAYSDTYFNSAPMTAANLFTHNRQYQVGIHPLLPKSCHPPKPADVQSETEFSLISNIYADDADAPWYAIEGPDLNPSCIYNNIIQNAITLSPQENALIAQFSRLTNVHHTLSPLTETISHFTFRSLPHVKKTTTQFG
jgi:hypothetical protein